MNPLLSFWIKVQPLGGCFGSHSWKALSQSSALASSSGDDATLSRSATTYSWAFDHLRSSASRFANHLYWDIFYWATSPTSWPLDPAISRVRDDVSALPPILRPSSRAVCEGLQRYPTTRRGVDAPSSVGPSRLTKGGRSASASASASPTPLQRSQQLLQQLDYVSYGIQPNLVRRNSKEWMPQYKKERIDKINYNNVFGGLSDVSNNEIPTLSAPPRESISRASSSPSREKPKLSLIQPDSPSSSSSLSSTITAATERTVESPSTLPSVEPVLSNAKVVAASPSSSSPATFADGVAPNDVICGRGGKANTHPGNISFREEAKKLRSWYESSSKSEKFTISSFLVDIVREGGGRFLRRDPDRPGGWLEADSSEVRKKASQALREGRRSN